LRRLLADKLGESVNGQVFVDNRAGAGGTIAPTPRRQGRPDGYTILMPISGPLAIARLSFESFPYDPLKELTPISQVACCRSLCRPSGSAGALRSRS